MKKIILLIITLLFFTSLVSAQLNMEMSITSEFNINEKISFDYSINSKINQNITYISGIDCFKAPRPLLKLKTIELKVNQPYIDTYYDIIIDNSIEPQLCTAYIQILEPIQQTVFKNFTINTNPSFDFNILLDKKIFVLGEEINIDYESSVEDVEIVVMLSLDENKKQIILPYSFNAKEIGTYDLEITAYKEGYKDVVMKEQFGVIEEEANIEYGFKEEKVNLIRKIKDFLRNFFN